MSYHVSFCSCVFRSFWYCGCLAWGAEGGAGLGAFRAFVPFVLVCRFPLPLCVWWAGGGGRGGGGGWGAGCSLWLWHSLGFSLAFFFYKQDRTYNTGTTLEWSVWKLLGWRGGGFKQFNSCETPPWILLQFQITNICSVCIGVLYRLQWNTYNKKYCDKTKQRAQLRSEARTQENHEQDHDKPKHRHW